MKTIIQSMLEETYTAAIKLARENSQVVGEENDYFITLAQLEAILKRFEG